ncbi:S1C family serine protease [Streptomyces yaizuensis]|uniref:Trypsin-like peptidase domain-containing protein n=1 Tax=Streptomyces yaizuensis TaxID=2989713 RepID=A0ABQ5NUQ7_9ACTN|nr:trypsin-like peptidase domain-containing protein [Streptomyces sp. YSPA8]GLF94096.1 trypsin-like peptidase domain-containing protein [Streptomyces sp. YSPA8]
MEISPRRLLPLTALLCAAVLATTAGCAETPGGPDQAAAWEQSRNSTSTRPVPAPQALNDLQTDYETVIRNVLPSVVQIESGNSLGSGVVYDSKGHVITNAHVVGSGRSFLVTVATGEEPLTAKLVSSYPEQDLAVIKLDSLPVGLKPAKFGDSSEVTVGQIVLAMGSPLGLSSSVTQGIVSGIGRTVTESAADGGTGATIGNMVQTSAAINPGNSGGALVNLDSEVIGIPTLAATDPGLGDAAAPGIGFAIPVSMVTTVADQIISTGRVTDSGRAALEITGRTVLDDNYQPAGVAIVEVVAGGAADKAGLRAGDIITKVGSQEITTITSLAEALAPESPGEKVVVGYLRDGEARTVRVTLGEI